MAAPGATGRRRASTDEPSVARCDPTPSPDARSKAGHAGARARVNARLPNVKVSTSCASHPLTPREVLHEHAARPELALVAADLPLRNLQAVAPRASAASASATTRLTRDEPRAPTSPSGHEAGRLNPAEEARRKTLTASVTSRRRPRFDAAGLPVEIDQVRGRSAQEQQRGICHLRMAKYPPIPLPRDHFARSQLVGELLYRFFKRHVHVGLRPTSKDGDSPAAIGASFAVHRKEASS